MVAGKISKMADIKASSVEGAEKVGLRQDTQLFFKRFVLTKVPKQSHYNETFLKASTLLF